MTRLEIRLSLAVSLLFVATTLAAQADLPIRDTTLANGLHVIVIENHAVPLVTVERELAQRTLVRVQLTDVLPIRRPISLVYRKNRKRSRTVQAFIDMMAEVYSAKTPVA